jgi:hypothetical protein
VPDCDCKAIKKFETQKLKILKKDICGYVMFPILGGKAKYLGGSQVWALSGFSCECCGQIGKV